MYIYAFLKSSANSLQLPPGIEGNLQIIETETETRFLPQAENVVAIAEPGLTSLATIEQDEQRLMQAVVTHDRILCELFNQTTILPLRFGTIFRSSADLIAHLNQRQKEYLAKLNQFEGKAEYTLKVVPLDAPVTAADPEAKGKAYLLAKKHRFSIVQEFQNQQNREWASLQQAIAHVASQKPGFYYVLGEPQGTTNRLYLLIPKNQESLLLEYVQTWQKNHPTWQLFLSESLPPYHFV
jgi:hypothetical protein